MDIGWFRDLVICIWGLVSTLLLVFVGILSYLLYRRTKYVLDSIEATSSTIYRVFSQVEDEIVKPVVQVMSLIQGIRQGIDLIARFFKKQQQEGGSDE